MKLETLTLNGKVYDGFPASPDSLPNSLPNPYPLTINGKTYNGSEAVDIVITGGTTGENTSLGQTPITLSKSANIKLVGDGEYYYTIKGKTVADLSTVEVSTSNVTMTEKEGYIELSVTGSPTDWTKAVAEIAVKGLVIGESYTFCIKSLGIDNVNLTYNGYILIRDTNNAELGRIEDRPSGLASVTFVASTENIIVRWYPANSHYWNNGYRTAQVGDIYINKASDGTERTGVFNESGTFTDSYSLGQVQKGVTITTEPSCEVYAVVGGISDGASASLAGKTVVCFGDSLFGMYTGEDSATAFVAKKTGATVHNVGFGGCRMSEHPYVGYNEFCMYALANAVASGDWSLQDAAASEGSANFPDQLAILKSIDFNAVDYIVIHYGTNDFAAGEGVAIDNASSPKATNTLCGALRYSVETLLAAFPKLNIFVSLPAFRFWDENGVVIYSDEKKNALGYTLPEYVKALSETANEYNLPVIDCYYGMGINRGNAATFLGDGTHHNIEGRKRFGEYIGTKLISGGDTFHGSDFASSGGVTTNADWVATKEPGSGDVVYIPEQKLTSGMWTKLQMSMQPGLNYAVTFNDEVYFCEAMAYGQGVTLGNDPYLSLNDYPFCIQWAGGNATSGMFFKDSGISYPITIKVTDYVYVYNKMPVEYLPNEAALKSEIPTDDHINDLIDTAIDNLEIPEGGGGGTGGSAEWEVLMNTTLEEDSTVIINNLDDVKEAILAMAAPQSPDGTENSFSSAQKVLGVNLNGVPIKKKSNGVVVWVHAWRTNEISHGIMCHGATTSTSPDFDTTLLTGNFGMGRSNLNAKTTDISLSRPLIAGTKIYIAVRR